MALQFNQEHVAPVFMPREDGTPRDDCSEWGLQVRDRRFRERAGFVTTPLPPLSGGLALARLADQILRSISCRARNNESAAIGRVADLLELEERSKARLVNDPESRGK